MADPLTCWDKVEDAIKAVVLTVTELAGWTVATGDSADVAISDERWPAILIWTLATAMDQSDEQNQSIHTMTVEIEFVSGGGNPGALNRKNKLAISRAHAAIAQDRTLGGMLLDIQENDIAPARTEGKDVSGASLQYTVQFFTPRDDWLTIEGQGGAIF